MRCNRRRLLPGEGFPQSLALPAVRGWTELLPRDLQVLVCQLLGPQAVAAFAAADKRAQELGTCEEVWSYFCVARWGSSANFHAYKAPKALYLDGNGWFPQRGGRRLPPSFSVESMRLHEAPCLTMDLRITEQEIVAVSEAPFSTRKASRNASVQIIDPKTRAMRESFEVSDATINCCDVGPGLVCLGSDDSKVRIYRRSSTSACSGSRYKACGEFACASEVNDLRYCREEAVLAVRTHQNRHPAGLDLIPVERPESRLSFPGGGRATQHKYIHALDGFEDGCSLGSVACSGEDPVTSAFSAMLFDFRRSSPCVLDLPVATVQRGQAPGTMLWPLRAGRMPKVYANLLHEDLRKQGRGTIAMLDLRFPTTGDYVEFNLPGAVDDFRCLGESIYAACTDSDPLHRQNLRVYRCTPSSPGVAEHLCTVAEAYDAKGRSPREDLKVFSVCQQGFAVSYGERLALGSILEPAW